MLATTSFVTEANPWRLLISSGGMIWRFIWGGIKFWHVRQAQVLHEKISPLLQELKDEQSRQAGVLDVIHHEVNLNSGLSVKDTVLAIRGSQSTMSDTLGRLDEKVDNIDKGLARHLGLHDGMAQRG